MINRPIIFEVVYKVGNDWKREQVQTLFAPPRYPANLATTVSGVEVNLGDVLNVSLLQFVGEFDVDGTPIFHGHILSDPDGNLFEVVFYHGAFWFQKDEQGEMLSTAVSSKLKIVGDSIQNANLLVPDKPEEIMEASKDRKVEPPFVDIKL